MTPEQQRALYDALLSAFPTSKDFEQVVRFAFGTSLDQLGAGDDDYTYQVVKIIQWAIASGHVEDLISSACEKRPDNPALRSFASSWAASKTTVAERGGLAEPIPGGRTDEGAGTSRTRPSGRRAFVSTPEELMQLMNFGAAWMFSTLSTLFVVYLVGVGRAPWWAVLVPLALILPLSAMFSRRTGQRSS